MSSLKSLFRPLAIFTGCLPFFHRCEVAFGQTTGTIGQNFTASTYSLHTASAPPDSNGSIGPRHFMEFINGTVAVYNKTNGLSVQRKSNLKFWSDAGLIISPDYAVSDPRVIYDPLVQRWFASEVNFHASSGDPTLEANDFLLAVSATSDPTGQWRGFSVQADPNSGYFADFPTLGVDSNAVYLSGDFYFGETNPVASGLVSIPKSDLLSSTPTIVNRTWSGLLDYVTHGEVLQPATCLDGSGSGNVLGMGDIGSDGQTHSNILSFVVQNAGMTNASLTAPTSIAVAPYVVPFNSSLGYPLFNPVQPDGTSYLSANDGRLSAKVYCVSGVLYAVHSTQVNSHIAIRWYRINAATQTLLESGTISDPNLDLFFPSIAANNSGTVVIACNGSGLSTTVSCFALVGETINGTTTFGSRILLQAGATSYHGDDEVFAILLDQPPISRWGDYSALSVDPADSTHFWCIQMFPSDAANANVWSTQITELLTIPANPKLSITLAPPNAVVSWPATAIGFNLEAKPTLNPTNSWTQIAQTFSTNNGRISFQTPLTNATRFFRLHKL